VGDVVVVGGVVGVVVLVALAYVVSVIGSGVVVVVVKL
jgi:hypothetical protein